MSDLTARQQSLLAIWHQHGQAEFVARDADLAIRTMHENAYILVAPAGQIFTGRDEIYTYYTREFFPNIPDEVEFIPVMEVAGQTQIAGEYLMRFTHEIEMPWMIPGIAPTGRIVELAMMVMVTFQGDLIASEHLVWDYASILYQLGVVTHPAASQGLTSFARIRERLSQPPMPLTK